MKIEYNLDPKEFTIVTKGVRKLKCNNCEKQKLFYLYSKNSKNCQCLNPLYVTKGSKVRLINAKLIQEDKAISEDIIIK